ncbi:MAG: hypothetical protein P1S46_04130 [bacterium]|nr:hypothetical protein [bacterium]MDT8395633.1 hypothetical protein [bacterium]
MAASLGITFIVFQATPQKACAGAQPDIRLLLDEHTPRSVVRGESFTVESFDDGRWGTVVSKVRLAVFSPAPSGVRLDNRFSLAVSADRVIFRGAGYGHGVGLCQWRRGAEPSVG